MKEGRVLQLGLVVLGIGIGLALGTGLHAGAQDSKEKVTNTVRAHKFELVDKKGNVTAVLGEFDGGAGFALKDHQNLPSIVIFAGTKTAGPVISLMRVNQEDKGKGSSIELRADEEATIRLQEEKTQKDKYIK